MLIHATSTHGIEFPLIAGILASMVHVWAGPDHLAAVVPLVNERARRHWKIGAWWGLGHLGGMLIIGLLYYFFKDLIPVEAISGYSEQLVGIILILIGGRALWRAQKRQNVHEHPHIHEDEEGTYIHIHTHQHTHQKHKHRERLAQDARTALGIGVVHGLAGVSHFLIMLPVLGFHSDFSSAQYLFGFGLGTVAAMGIFAFLLGRLQRLPRHEHRPKFLKALQVIGGIAAVLVGIFWLGSI